jgi:hypothetical protein
MTERSGERLRPAVDAARSRAEKLKAVLAGRGTGVTAGDLFLFRLPGELAFCWAALFSHPDDAAVWFAVPVDDNPLAGSADLAAVESASGDRVTLRCGLGLWIPQTAFGQAQRAGVVAEGEVRQARARLAALARGKLQVSADQEATENEPAYQAWMTEVAGAEETLSRLLAGPLDSPPA